MTFQQAVSKLRSATAGAVTRHAFYTPPRIHILSRPGTSRPVTSSGRFVRLGIPAISALSSPPFFCRLTLLFSSKGTASLKQEPGGPFLDIERMYARSHRMHLFFVVF